MRGPCTANFAPPYSVPRRAPQPHASRSTRLGSCLHSPLHQPGSLHMATEVLGLIHKWRQLPLLTYFCLRSACFWFASESFLVLPQTHRTKKNIRCTVQPVITKAKPLRDRLPMALALSRSVTYAQSRRSEVKWHCCMVCSFPFRPIGVRQSKVHSQSDRTPCTNHLTTSNLFYLHLWSYTEKHCWKDAHAKAWISTYVCISSTEQTTPWPGVRR